VTAMRKLRKLLSEGSVANTGLILPQVLVDRLIEIQGSKLVLRNLPGVFTDNSVRTMGDTATYTITIKPGTAGSAVAYENIGPGGEIPQSEEGIDHQITLQVKKAGIRPVVPKELVEDGKWNMLSRNIMKATDAMARLVDEGVGRGMTTESGAFPITGINCQYLLERQGAVTASGFSFPDDFLAMQSALEVNNGKLTDVVMHPNFYPGIRAAEWFKNVSNTVQAGATGPAGPNGFVGEGYGVRFWQSTNLAYSGTTIAGSGVVIGYDAGQMPFVFLDKRPLTIENAPDPIHDLSSSVFTQRFNVMNIQPSAVCWVTGVYKTYYRDVTAGRAF
jgi:hypothetical protein